jgi:hypothetical protein
MAKKNINTKKSVEWKFPYNKKDLIWLCIGIAVVILGYALMATGISEEPALPEGNSWNNHIAVNVAPVVLFIGYLVIIPLALFKFFSRKKNKKTDNINTIK